MSYKVLLFDIDGTLIRAGGAGKEALVHTLRQLHAIEEPQVNIQFGGRTDQSICRELFGLHGLPWTSESGLEFLEVYTEHFRQSLQIQAPILLPGVKPLLEQLKQLNRHDMGLLTGNMERSAKLKLNAFSLWPYFDFGGFGDHHEDRSEIAGDAFRKASLRHPKGLQGHEVLIIGDTAADVRCARAIGADVLIVGTGPVPKESIEEAKPDYYCDDLSGLESILAILNR